MTILGYGPGENRKFYKSFPSKGKAKMGLSTSGGMGQPRAGNRSVLRAAMTAGIQSGRMTARFGVPKQSYGAYSSYQGGRGRAIDKAAFKAGKSKQAKAAYEAGVARGMGGRQKRVPAGSPRGGQFSK